VSEVEPSTGSATVPEVEPSTGSATVPEVEPSTGGATESKDSVPEVDSKEPEVTMEDAPKSMVSTLALEPSTGVATESKDSVPEVTMEDARKVLTTHKYWCDVISNKEKLIRDFYRRSVEMRTLADPMQFMLDARAFTN